MQATKFSMLMLLFPLCVSFFSARAVFVAERRKMAVGMAGTPEAPKLERPAIMEGGPIQDAVLRASISVTDYRELKWAVETATSPITIEIPDNIDFTGNATIDSAIKVSEGQDVEIVGTGSLRAVLNAKTIKNKPRRHFENSGTLVLNNLELINGGGMCNGGAVYNNGGIMTITNSEFSGNGADGGGGHYGGAIYNDDGGSITIMSSVFNGNTAINGFYGFGGAVHNDGGNIAIASSVFRFNGADGCGAVCNDGGDITITNSEFNANSAGGNNGGAVCNYGGDVMITNSVFNGNAAVVDDDEDIRGGGALYSNGGNLTITSSEFSGNLASQLGEGGAIYIESANDVLISNSEFKHNRASKTEAGQDISIVTGVEALLRNVRFQNIGWLPRVSADALLNCSNAVVPCYLPQGTSNCMAEKDGSHYRGVACSCKDGFILNDKNTTCISALLRLAEHNEAALNKVLKTKAIAECTNCSTHSNSGSMELHLTTNFVEEPQAELQTLVATEYSSNDMLFDVATTNQKLPKRVISGSTTRRRASQLELTSFLSIENVRYAFSTTTSDWGGDRPPCGACYGALLYAKPRDGCSSLDVDYTNITLPAPPPGAIIMGVALLVDGGSCDFSMKGWWAQEAGAAMLVVANNDGGDHIFTMSAGALAANITIPVVMISQNSGSTLKLNRRADDRLTSLPLCVAAAGCLLDEANATSPSFSPTTATPSIPRRTLSPTTTSPTPTNFCEEPGTYLIGATSTACAECPAGYFQATPGQRSCNVCPPGTQARPGGSTSTGAESQEAACEPCPPNTYTSMLTPTPLVPECTSVFCDPGEYAKLEALRFVESIKDRTNTTEPRLQGLREARSVVGSPNGRFVYVVGSNAVWFFRAKNAITLSDRLVLAQTLRNGGVDDAGGAVSGLNGACSAAVSADGRFLFVAASVDNAITVFAIDGVWGRLGVLQTLRDGSDDDAGTAVDGLNGVRSVAVSADGRFLYAAAFGDSSVTVFGVDGGAGRLGVVQTLNTGTAVDGLGGASCVVVSANGRLLFVTAYSDAAVTVFAIDGDTGQLHTVQTLRDGDVDDAGAAVDSLRGAFSAVTSVEGRLLFVAAVDVNTVTVFEIDGDTGRLSMVQTLRDGDVDDAGTAVDSLDGARSVAVSSDGQFLFVVAYSDAAVVMFAIDNATGRLGVVQTLRDSTDDDVGAVVDSLGSPRNVAVFGRLVFVVASSVTAEDSVITIFAIDREAERLDKIQTLCDSCVENTGTVANGLAYPLGVAVSVDGRFLFVAAMFSSAVTVFGIDGDTGRLGMVQKLAHNKTDDAGKKVEGLHGAFSAAVSTDGRHLFVVGHLSNAITVFTINNSTGRLGVLQKLSKDDVDATGTALKGLHGPTNVVVSPNGRFIFVAATKDSSVTVFAIDSGTGLLNMVQTFRNDAAANGLLRGAFSMAVSPTGRILYTAAYGSAAIVAFTIDGGTGRLGVIQTLHDGGVDDMGATVDGLVGARSMVVSGRFLFVAALDSDAVLVFTIDDRTGRLSVVQTLRDGGVDDAGTAVDGLDGPASVAVSANGRFLFVAADLDSTITVFDINGVTGRLRMVRTLRKGSIDDTGAVVGGLNGAESVAVSVDGRFVFVADIGDGAITVLRAVVSCQLCERGHHCPGDSSKLVCAAGEEQPDLAQANCTACTPGRYTETEASARCTACESGTFGDRGQPQNASTHCVRCPTASYNAFAGVFDACVECLSGKSGKLGEGHISEEDACEVCPPGSMTAAPGQEHCAPCRVDTYQDEEGKALCEDCAVVAPGAHTFNLTAAFSEKACLVCPINAECNARMVLARVARAVEGNEPLVALFTAFNRSAHEQGRVPSADGGCSDVDGCVCAHPAKGRYRFPPNTCVTGSDGNCPIVGMRIKCPASEQINFEGNCTNADACDASSLEGCAEGYTGVLCTTCAANYTKAGDFKCIACANRGSVIAAIVLLALVAAAVVVYFIRSTVKSMGKAKNINIAQIKIVASHLQVVGIVVLFPLEWCVGARPRPIKSMFVVSGDIVPSSSGSALGTVSLTCEVANWSSFGSPFYTESVLTACLPLLILGACAAFWASRVARGELNPDHLKQRIGVSTVVVLFLLHVSLTKAALRFFACTNPLYAGELEDATGETIDFGHHQFLQADTRVECWTGSHNRWAFGLGVAMGILYAFGIPLFAFYVLWSIKHNLAKWRPTYGFLYSSYDPPFWYWEVVIVIKKVLLASAAVLLQRFGVEVQTNVSIFVIVLWLAMQLRYKPFVVNSLNNLEASALATQFLTLSAGMLCFADGVQDSKGIKVFLMLVIVMSNMLFLGAAARMVYQSSQQSLKELKRAISSGAELASAIQLPSVRTPNGTLEFIGLSSSMRAPRSRSARSEAFGETDADERCVPQSALPATEDAALPTGTFTTVVQPNASNVAIQLPSTRISREVTSTERIGVSTAHTLHSYSTRSDAAGEVEAKRHTPPPALSTTGAAPPNRVVKPNPMVASSRNKIYQRSRRSLQKLKTMLSSAGSSHSLASETVQLPPTPQNDSGLKRPLRIPRSHSAHADDTFGKAGVPKGTVHSNPLAQTAPPSTEKRLSNL